MTKPIMNLDEVAFDDIEDNGKYTSRRGQISDHIGAEKLDYNLTVVPPGKTQCPFHCHHGEEEMFFIIEGEGELTYSRVNPALIIADHTGVPDSFRGKGVAKALVQRLVDDARAQGVKIIPLCPYVNAERRKHPDWSDVFQEP